MKNFIKALLITYQESCGHYLFCSSSVCFQVGKNMAYARSLFSAGDKFGPQVGYQREKLALDLGKNIYIVYIREI